MGSEEELDLTLSLRCGGSKETPAPFLSLPPTNPSQSNFFQILCPNPNLNFSLASSSNNTTTTLPLLSSNDNSNSPNAPAKADEVVSTATPSQRRSRRSNPNVNFSLASSSNNDSTNLPLVSSNHNRNSPNAPAKADEVVSTAAPSLPRSRRSSSARRSKGTSETIPVPFPWAMNKRATVRSRQYLLENNLHTITGKVHCKRCDQEFELGLDLVEKLADFRKYFNDEKATLHGRAPNVWLNPVYPKCALCGRQNSTKPVLGKNKKEINWLFLFLGQMLGCCTLDHLKYFCKHNDIHRTGAKDRLLYYTYTNLMKQLEPDFSDS